MSDTLKESAPKTLREVVRDALRNSTNSLLKELDLTDQICKGIQDRLAQDFQAAVFQCGTYQEKYTGEQLQKLFNKIKAGL